MDNKRLDLPFDIGAQALILTVYSDSSYNPGIS
jgi:hypothetical protein